MLRYNKFIDIVKSGIGSYFPTKQYVTFVDPKGLRNLRGLEDDKINLHKTIRETIEPRLNDKDIVLNSFIISNTPFTEIDFWEKGTTIEAFNDKHVFSKWSRKGHT